MNKIKKNRTPWMILVAVAMLIILTQMSTYIFAPNPEKDSWGKILSPAADSIVNDEIIVIGETQDIASGQYIWIAFETPGEKFCTPKKRVLRNTRFRAAVSVENKEKTAVLTLYVLDETVHKLWTDWKKKQISNGLPLPAENRRLDMVTLKFRRTF